ASQRSQYQASVGQPTIFGSLSRVRNLALSRIILVWADPDYLRHLCRCTRNNRLQPLASLPHLQKRIVAWRSAATRKGEAASWSNADCDCAWFVLDDGFWHI